MTDIRDEVMNNTAFQIDTHYLQFENGRLVKVNGMRPEYMDGMSLIDLARTLGAEVIRLRTALALSEARGLDLQGQVAALIRERESLISTKREQLDRIGKKNAALKANTARARRDALEEAAEKVAYFREVSGRNQDGDSYVGEEAACFGASITNEIIAAIRAAMEAGNDRPRDHYRMD